MPQCTRVLACGVGLGELRSDGLHLSLGLALDLLQCGHLLRSDGEGPILGCGQYLQSPGVRIVATRTASTSEWMCRTEEQKDDEKSKKRRLK